MSSVRWTHLVATPGNRKRVIIAVSLGFFAQLCGAGVVSYYISLVLKTIGITNPTHQSLINGLLQVFNFLVSVFLGALMVDRLGRRTLFLWSAAGMGFSYIVSVDQGDLIRVQTLTNCARHGRPLTGYFSALEMWPLASQLCR